MSEFPLPPDSGNASLADKSADASSLPKEALPPVQPPTAGFIMQLFFIPLIIVSIIVVVWLLFSWMAQMGSSPEEMVEKLERLDTGSWQSAKTLGDMLRDPRQEELRNNAALATRLANLLESQFELGEKEHYPPTTAQEESDAYQVTQQVFLRVYLARVLGEFEVTAGVPVLIEAAGLERHPLEVKVRRAAVESLAQQLSRHPVEEMCKPSEQEALLAVLLEGSTERDPNEAREVMPLENDQQRLDAFNELSTDEQNAAKAASEQAHDRLMLRSTSVFALGLMGGPEAVEALADRLEDPHPDVRANAAVGLARQGDPRAVAPLAEMLDPANEEIVRYEKESDHAWKRMQVMLTALNAAVLLAEQSPTSPALDPLREAVAEVASMTPEEAKQAGVSLEVIDEAGQVQQRLENLRSAPAL